MADGTTKQLLNFREWTNIITISQQTLSVFNASNVAGKFHAFKLIQHFIFLFYDLFPTCSPQIHSEIFIYRTHIVLMSGNIKFCDETYLNPKAERYNLLYILETTESIHVGSKSLNSAYSQNDRTDHCVYIALKLACLLTYLLTYSMVQYII
jgi:hypothetical protein